MLVSVPALCDDPLVPQDCQMLRHQRLLQIKVGCETANGLISLNQPTHDHETMRTCQRPQEIAGVRRPFCHVCSFYLHTCAYACVRIYCQYRKTTDREEFMAHVVVLGAGLGGVIAAYEIRDQLRKAGFYSEWKGKYGDEAWAILERSVGKLS